MEIRLIAPTRALLTFCSMRTYVDVDVPILFAISFWVMPAYFRACSMVNFRRFSISFTSFCVNYNSTKVECQAKSSESRNFYCIFATLCFKLQKQNCGYRQSPGGYPSGLNVFFCAHFLSQLRRATSLTDAMPGYCFCRAAKRANAFARSCPGNCSRSSSIFVPSASSRVIVTQ